jgi:DNA-binding NarL/FixJ family response regulator
VDRPPLQLPTVSRVPLAQAFPGCSACPRHAIEQAPWSAGSSYDMLGQVSTMTQPRAGQADTRRDAVRVVIGEDQPIMREGVIRILERAGVEVVSYAANAIGLVAMALAERPDVVLTDIQMPPGNTDDGLRAALEIRTKDPTIGVILLSQFLDDRYAVELVANRAQGVGYLLKEKVASPEILIEAVRRVAEGGSALDPDVISRLVGRRRVDNPLDALTQRERDVLGLMAEGLSNAAIAQRLVVTVPAVARHVTGIFTKLDLPHSELGHHRRVAAVLAWLHR